MGAIDKGCTVELVGVTLGSLAKTLVHLDPPYLRLPRQKEPRIWPVIAFNVRRMYAAPEPAHLAATLARVHWLYLLMDFLIRRMDKSH